MMFSYGANMRAPALSLFLAASLILNTEQSCAEKWIEFHKESWSHDSKKLKRKLHFSNYSYYDAESLSMSANGDVTVLTRDISQNDRFYVGKGIPEKEVVYKQILLRCSSVKYEVILEDVAESEIHESIGEEIRAGSTYDKLFKRVCNIAR